MGKPREDFVCLLTQNASSEKLLWTWTTIRRLMTVREIYSVYLQFNYIFIELLLCDRYSSGQEGYQGNKAEMAFNSHRILMVRIRGDRQRKII